MEFLRRTQTHLVGRAAAVATAVVFSALMSVALLPLATRVLHASDYGTYTILMSLVALVGTAMDGGATLLLPAAYGPAPSAERGRIFASIALFAGIGAGIAGLLLTAFWIWQHVLFTEHPLPTLILALTAVLMPLRAITNVAVVTLIVTGRNTAVAGQMVGQAIAVFASTLIALFGFEMEGVSLFIGVVCGQIIAMAICLFELARHGELSSPSRKWMVSAVASAPANATAAFADGARSFSENVILAAVSGPHIVGILGHARLYYKLFMGLGGSITKSVWSRSLDEARDTSADFRITRNTAVFLQVGFGCAGLLFVFVGRQIVDAITNGKFDDAANYIPALLVIALIQISAGSASAVVYASGAATSAAWFRTASVLTTLLLLYPAIIYFGIKGILTLYIIESVGYRFFLRTLAARLRTVPFQDEVAVLACVAMGAAAALVHFVALSLSLKLFLLIAGSSMILFVGYRASIEMFPMHAKLRLGQQTS